jgi:hypothetical protein
MSGSAFADSQHEDHSLLEISVGDRTKSENFAFRLFDEAGRFFINSHCNLVDSARPLRKETLSVCLPGGRAFVERETTQAAPAAGPLPMTAMNGQSANGQYERSNFDVRLER